MTWQDELKRQIDEMGDYEWCGDGDLRWATFIVSIRAMLPLESLMKMVGCVNECDLAGLPRGVVRLDFLDAKEGMVSTLGFGVRPGCPWNHFSMARYGKFVMTEVFAADGSSPYPYRDFGLIA